MTDNFRGTPKPKNVFSERKLHLRAPCPTPEGDGKWSTLQVEVNGNNPRITVWTNCPNDTGEHNDYGKIQANMDFIVYNMLMSELTRIIDMPTPSEPYRLAIANKKDGWDRNANKRTEPYEVSTTFIGKDVDGTVWISVKSKKKERPAIKFVFRVPDYHDVRNADGTPWTDGQKSQLAARAWVKALGDLMPIYLVHNYVEPKPKDGGNNNGGNRGGYNNNGGNRNSNGGGGNRGGYSEDSGSRRSNSDFDDDVPF